MYRKTKGMALRARAEKVESGTVRLFPFQDETLVRSPLVLVIVPRCSRTTSRSRVPSVTHSIVIAWYQLTSLRFEVS